MVGSRLAGGCLLPEAPPNWQCSRRHQWRELDESVWEQQLIEVLTGYGYRDPDETEPRATP